MSLKTALIVGFVSTAGVVGGIHYIIEKVKKSGRKNKIAAVTTTKEETRIFEPKPQTYLEKPIINTPLKQTKPGKSEKLPKSKNEKKKFSNEIPQKPFPATLYKNNQPWWESKSKNEIEGKVSAQRQPKKPHRVNTNERIAWRLDL
ncbi:hypothetical protein G9A89_003420 [Geosiphon pyriformis]|nr:hypothetical protein G9A89_003420 [Geosiphon pyriformis]